jgi:hypothetical protein
MQDDQSTPPGCHRSRLIIAVLGVPTLVAGLVSATVGLSAQHTPAIACRPDSTLVAVGSRVTLRAFVEPVSEDLRYKWSVDGGAIAGDGPTIDWQLPPGSPQRRTARVDVSGRRSAASCALQIFTVRDPDKERGPETRRLFLLKDQEEPQGLHLYSYLLFGGPPSNDQTRDRYRAALDAYLALIPLSEDWVGKGEYNATMFPIDSQTLPVELDRDSLLKVYDWERSRSLLQRLPGTHLDGPYIVSSAQPLTQMSRLTRNYLFQDLSAVPPALANAWVREFVLQAAQEHYWKERGGPMLALKLRTTISILAGALPAPPTAIANMIAWR